MIRGYFSGYVRDSQCTNLVIMASVHNQIQISHHFQIIFFTIINTTIIDTTIITTIDTIITKFFLRPVLACTATEGLSLNGSKPLGTSTLSESS